MIELIALATALLGSAIAGIWDLLTTEVPDEIPALMISFGVFGWYASALTTGNFLPLFYSLAFGTLILAAGWLLYKKGHWGGADAFILAAIAYVMPVYNGRLLLADYLLNFLAVSSAYMIIYALALGAARREVFGYLAEDIRKNIRMLAIILSAFAVPALFLAYSGYASGINMFAAAALITLFWRYAHVIEQKIFRKRIPSSELKAGDVVEDMIWRGITEEEIAKIRKSKKYVVVKEGIRFVPVFSITLLVTVLYGNVFFAFIHP